MFQPQKLKATGSSLSNSVHPYKNDLLEKGVVGCVRKRCTMCKNKEL
jgi:hypothetical protein